MTEKGINLDALLGKLWAIPEIRQRSHALATRLAGFDNDTVVMVIKAIREQALAGDADCLSLYNGLLFSDVLTSVMGDSRMSELAATAQEKGEFEIVAILSDLPGKQGEETPYQPFLDVGLREVPLGARKALARKPDFKLIKRIAKDQDPRVIRPLLDNPRLTEMDVTRIASTRPTSPQVLEAIYNHPRWLTRYTVKKVIILNPYTPLQVALKLLTFMQIQDLEEICRSPDLNSRLLEAARRLVEDKRPPIRKDDTS